MQITISRAGQTFGPFTVDQLQTYLANGTILPTDLMWQEGMTDWQPVSSIYRSGPPAQTQTQTQATTPTVQAPILGGQPTQRTVQTTQSTGYPTTPRRRPSSTRTTYTPPQPKKNPFAIFSFILGSLVVIWLGITFAIGLITKRTFEQEIKESSYLSLGNYKMGLFSSEAVTLVKMGESETLTLQHNIKHGPITLSKKPKLALSDISTEFKFPDNPEFQRTLSLDSKVGINGNSTHLFQVYPYEYTNPEGSKTEWDGGTITVKTLSNSNKIVANLDLSGINMIDTEGTLRIGKTTGNVTYSDDGHLEIDTIIGGFDIEAADAAMFMHLKSPKIKCDFKRHSEDFPIYVGNAAIIYPELTISYSDLKLSFKDTSLKVNSAINNAKYSGSVTYEIGSTDYEGPEEFHSIRQINGSVKTGIKNLDARIIAKIAKHYQTINEQHMSGLMTDAEVVVIDEEILKMMGEITTSMLDLIKPGAEIYSESRLTNNEIKIDLAAKYGGSRSLTKTKTIREAISGLEGEFKFFGGEILLNNPSLLELVSAYEEVGIGKLDTKGFHFDAKIENGSFFLGDQESSFIESFGEMLDEPTDWDAIVSGLNSILTLE